MPEFACHVLLSFLVAGVWITGATVVAERFGSKLGGLIGNLPATIVVAFFFIGLTQGPEFTREAARAVPTGMTIDAVFLFVFVVSLRAGILPAVILSLGSWFLLALVASGLHNTDWLATTVLYLAVTVMAFLVMERGLKIRSVARSTKKYSLAQLGARAGFAGSVVASTVIVARLSGPYWAGLFSIFPAVMLSTMVILSRVQGADFARATGKVLVLSSTNIVIFGAAVYLTFPFLGLGWGILASYGAAFLWVLALRPVINRLS
jgi:hypothetical protein